MSRTIDQLAETGSSAPDDYLIKRNTTTGADQRISVANFSNFPAMPQVNGAPIVESGSNSDGEWTRWADGTQQCTRSANHDLSTTSIQSYPFPVSFAERGIAVVAVGNYSFNPGSSTYKAAGSLVSRWRAYGVAGWEVGNPDPGDETSLPVLLYATGYWK